MASTRDAPRQAELTAGFRNPGRPVQAHWVVQFRSAGRALKRTASRGWQEPLRCAGGTIGTAVKLFALAVGGLVAAAVAYFVVYLGVTYVWFGLTGANPKIGPSDLGVPLLVFHLTTTGTAAVAAGAAAALVLERSAAALVRIIGGTVAVTVAVVTVHVLALDGDPDQSPYHVAVAAVVAAALGVVQYRSRRRRSAVPQP